MKNILDQMRAIDLALGELLEHDIDTVRAKMIEMFKDTSSDKSVRRKDRLMSTYLLERMHDIEQITHPMWGREDYQKLIDQGLTAMDNDVLGIQGTSVVEVAIPNEQMDTLVKGMESTKPRTKAVPSEYGAIPAPPRKLILVPRESRDAVNGG